MQELSGGDWSLGICWQTGQDWSGVTIVTEGSLRRWMPALLWGVLGVGNRVDKLEAQSLLVQRLELAPFPLKCSLFVINACAISSVN